MRAIDADRLQKQFDLKSTNPNYRVNIHNIKSIITNAPSIEAIPKADYEARLKADLEAILKDLQLEIEECVDGAEGSPQFEQGVTIARVQVVEVIQQKINSLKEDKE